MPTPDKQIITAEWLIVGEGDGDKDFCRYLSEVRNITGLQYENAQGNKDFEKFLKGVQARTGFQKVKGLLVVADSDETPDESFRSVQRQIERAHFPRPNNRLQKATKQGFPCAVAVLMLPYPNIGADSHGCLETLLLPAAERQFPNQRACVDTYCQCITACGGKWSKTAQSKMHLRCLLSASCPDDPNIALRHALKPERNVIPLTDSIFDPVAIILTNFAAWMASIYQNWAEFEATLDNGQNAG